jgi:serine acetyltransferase
VTGEIPPCVTCAGIPAKIIRTGASWTYRLHPTKAEIRAVQSFLKTVAESK